MMRKYNQLTNEYPSVINISVCVKGGHYSFEGKLVKINVYLQIYGALMDNLINDHVYFIQPIN